MPNMAAQPPPCKNDSIAQVDKADLGLLDSGLPPPCHAHPVPARLSSSMPTGTKKKTPVIGSRGPVGRPRNRSLPCSIAPPSIRISCTCDNSATIRVRHGRLRAVHAVLEEEANWQTEGPWISLVAASVYYQAHPASSTPLPQRKRTAQCPSATSLCNGFLVLAGDTVAGGKPRRGRKKENNTSSRTGLVHGTQDSPPMPGRWGSESL